MSADQPEYIRWLSRRCGDIVLAAVDRDADRAATLICEAGEEYGDEGVYALCCGLAEAIAVMGRFERGGVHGFEVHQRGRGVIAPEEAGADLEGAVAAFRFVSAHLNGDEDTKWALFNAAPVATAGGVANLAGMYGRHRRAEDSKRPVRKAKRRKRRRP